METTTGEATMEAEEANTDSDAETDVETDAETLNVIELEEKVEEYSKQLFEKPQPTKNTMELQAKTWAIATAQFPQFSTFPPEVRDAYILRLLPQAKKLLKEEKLKKKEELRGVEELKKKQQEEEQQKREESQSLANAERLFTLSSKHYLNELHKEQSAMLSFAETTERTPENIDYWHNIDHYSHYAFEKRLFTIYQGMHDLNELRVKRLEHELQTLKKQITESALSSYQTSSRSNSVHSSVAPSVNHNSKQIQNPSPDERRSATEFLNAYQTVQKQNAILQANPTVLYSSQERTAKIAEARRRNYEQLNQTARNLVATNPQVLSLPSGTNINMPHTTLVIPPPD